MERLHLYLDFDGVLHDGDVYFMEGRSPFYRYPSMQGPLFLYAEDLARRLDGIPNIDIRIVLSTAWVRKKSFGYAMRRLPSGLRNRVIGATYHSEMMREQPYVGMYTTHSNRPECAFDTLSRYQAIALDAGRRGTRHWLAIDDDLAGWPDREKWRIVATEEAAALGEPGKMDELERRIVQFPFERTPGE